MDDSKQPIPELDDKYTNIEAVLEWLQYSIDQDLIQDKAKAGAELLIHSWKHGLVQIHPEMT